MRIEPNNRKIEAMTRAAERASFVARLNCTIHSFDSVANAIKDVTGDKRNPTFSLDKGIDGKLNDALKIKNISRYCITRAHIPGVMRTMSYGSAINEVVAILDQKSYSYSR